MFSKAFDSLQMKPLTLGLRGGTEIITMHVAMPLRSLRRLEFHLVVDIGYHRSSPFLRFDKASRASWVYGFESLEEHSLILAPNCNHYRSTFSLFCRTVLPRFRNVDLKRVRMFYIWLEAFLQAIERLFSTCVSRNLGWLLKSGRCFAFKSKSPNGWLQERICGCPRIACMSKRSIRSLQYHLIDNVFDSPLSFARRSRKILD